MERAVLITSAHSLAQLGSDFTRLYFGQEFCERLLPSPAQLQLALDFAAQRQLDFTLVTPFVTEAGFARVQALLASLAAKAPQAEVSVNDWGVLHHISEAGYGFALNLGRLLVKQKRGPQILSVRGKVPAAMWDHFQRATVDLPLTTEFLQRLGIRRLELDNLLQGLQRGAVVLPASLYYPYAYVTTTRICLSNSCEQRTEHLRAIFPCKQECRRYSFKLRHASMPETLWLKGNSIFFHNPNLPPELESLKIDRLVYEPDLPV